MKSSATRLVIGCTVEEPEIVMVPLRFWAVEPLAPPVLPVPPPSSLLHAAATSANTATVARTSRPLLRFPIPTSLSSGHTSALSSGHTIGGRYPATLNGLRRSDERGMNAVRHVNGGCPAGHPRCLHSRPWTPCWSCLRSWGYRSVALVALVFIRREQESAHRSVRERAAEHEQMRARVEASEAARRAADLALASMEEGVLLFGAEGETRLANAAVEGHLGVQPASVDALLPLGLRHLTERAAGAQAVLAVEVEIGAPTRTLRGFAAPAEDGSVVLVIRDITETRRSEQVRRDFVANASHELKTPAASIQAAAETIRTAAAEDPSVIPHFASQLEREAARLSRIVSDLLDLSRLESGSVMDETVALEAIVRDEGERFEGPAAEAGVGLSIEASSVPRVRGSARDLALLVRNLVDNAIRYTRPGGKVHVELTTEDGEVVLAIVDTGLGIPSRDLPRIFERFYRVDRARSRETGGTGLGLSIVKHVAENHGGRVEVTSELGQGTRFEVRLPASA